MHHLDLGLYHYQIEFTKELLSKSSIDKFNRRIAEIPRHPGLKIFAEGLQSIARLTANEFRDLMKVMVFVVDNLHNKDLSEVYVKWNEMYLLSRLETFKESDLKIFQKAIDNWVNLFIKLFQNISGLKFPKLHSWNIDLKIDGKRIWFYPRISTVICDWPEACTFSLTYKSSNSNYPCHFCLVSKDNLANTCLRKNQAVLRNKENMKKYYDNDTTKEASLEPVYNYFWDIP
ncbi:hypothetical protein Glove_59g124 [Diversispora epigaea]|uniref:Uncharacterized protein n=1 Tax=Diversispora epigaea TaxID=1348612 RepID=A0A397JBY2_9GLOM|nr:hypothetical protein Glove_59g124 [Diversispora epigaea]